VPRFLRVAVLPWLVLCLALMAFGAGAKQAAPESDDPVLEARVLAIAEELRCLVCQNETIAASRADLAVDLRKQIRLKLKAGQSKTQIVDFMVERYGDFVLYRPPFKATTLLLWLGPFLLLALSVVLMALNIRRRRCATQADSWTPAQAQRARVLLDEGKRNP
jgi:cytochrome c-type biogenesis protein CcmH